MLRHWRLLAAAVLPSLVLAGIGWWVWPQQPAAGVPHIAAGTVQAELLSADSVSRLAGTTVVAGPRSNRPHAALTVTPAECAVVAGPTTQAVYGQSWKAFLSATYQDADGTGAHTVNQVIGVFPDGERASAAFRTLTDGLSKCPTSTVTDQAGRSAKWAYATHAPFAAVVTWQAAQEGAANWACHHQARVTGTSLVQVTVCQGGDGALTTSKIADELAGQVAG
ncbi:hypothetical protein F4556_006824 [Kitasatospora gansuensis]|uniref:PknH-like extracellular domain-containing protein n=1 Tax=Kitasatospora gansuensis TaxID=258050 RepID=A0A7W7SIU7_9ACTN|nr:sensor domain-containing protein [Kitasatospora gansuensis]MBB4951289.1 hypothetical protein [Kitasatospora gansuensis]